MQSVEKSAELIKINQNMLIEKAVDFLDYMGMSNPGFLGKESDSKYQLKLEYLNEIINKLEESEGICYGSCVLKARCLLISRFQKDIKESKTDFTVHDNKWFTRTRLLLAQWTEVLDPYYTDSERNDIIFFIDQITLAQEYRHYLFDSKTDVNDLDISFPILTKGKDKQFPKFKNLGKIFGFYNAKELTKILNLILKENRYILLSSHNHTGLIFINHLGKIEFFDINQDQDDIVCQDIEEVVLFFSKFPELCADALPVRLYAYTISEYDTTFPSIPAIAELCDNKRITYCSKIPGYLGGLTSLNLSLADMNYFNHFITDIIEETHISVAQVIAMNFSRNSKEQLIKLQKSAPTIDLTVKDPSGKNLLMHAVIANNYPLIDYLLTQPLRLNSQDKIGWTAIMYAALKDNDTLFKKLLSAGCNPFIKDKQDKSAVSIAMEAKNDKIIEYLPHFKSKGNKTILMEAAQKNDLVSVMLLLEHKANINEVDNNGRTALFYAAAKGHKTMIQWLVSAGINNSSVDITGKSTQEYVIECKRHNIGLLPKPSNLEKICIENNSTQTPGLFS